MREDPEDTPAFRPDDYATCAVRAVLRDGLSRIRREEAAAYRFEVEAVHKMRAACRRLRSTLRAFGSFLDGPWAKQVGDELRWLGSCLGAVRDLDVLDAGLHEAASDFRAPALAPLFIELDARRDRVREALRKAFDTDRYRTLLERLERACERPPTTPLAGSPCQESLPESLNEAWKRLRRRARRLRPSDPTDAFHKVRVRAKRARYTAEAVAPGLDPEPRALAERLARRTAELQDHLGRLQDTVVATRFLQEFEGGELDHEGILPRLIERQKRAARKARKAGLRLWEKLDRRKYRRWSRWRKEARETTRALSPA
jgi:CHAD domain-containing protein